jgi:hypothetical protein
MNGKVTDKIGITNKRSRLIKRGYDLQKLREAKYRLHEEKPPVFIGLGAVFQQDFGTLFLGTGIPWLF